MEDLDSTNLNISVWSGKIYTSHGNAIYVSFVQIYGEMLLSKVRKYFRHVMACACVGRDG